MVPGYLKVGKRTTLTFLIYSEIELIPPSVSKLENFGLVESSAEVASAFEFFEYFLTLSCRGLTLPASDLTQHVCISFAMLCCVIT